MTKKQLIAILKRMVKDKKIGRMQRLARERFLNDLLHGEERGIYFSMKRALKALNFIERMKHIKGKLAGKDFELATWQKYDIVLPLFGFYKIVNGEKVRRFNIVFVFVARKNGKSMLAAAIGNYLAFADGEMGAECYCVATKRDQARLVWDVAEAMKNKSFLKKHGFNSF